MALTLNIFFSLVSTNYTMVVALLNTSISVGMVVSRVAGLSLAIEEVS